MPKAPSSISSSTPLLRDPSTISYPTTALARSKYRNPSTSKPLTSFQWRLYDLIRDLPAGRTTTYGLIAAKLVTSPRAVGTALSKNPFCPLIPCHRVIASDGKMGGFMGQTTGLLIEQKVKRLKEEGIDIQETKPGVWVVQALSSAGRSDRTAGKEVLWTF